MHLGKFWGGLVCTLMLAGGGPARSEVFDGLTYLQLKAILGTTTLGLTEQVTPNGNRYLLVMVPGWAMPFAATTASCPYGQRAPCDGFTFFFIDAGRSLDANAMGKFNESNFVKMFPSSEGAAPVIKGDYYARGGITDQNVLSASAYYTVVLQNYLGTSGTSALTGQAPAFTFADAANPQKFFAALAGRGKALPAPVGARTPAVDAMVDAFVAGGSRR